MAASSSHVAHSWRRRGGGCAGQPPVAADDERPYPSWLVGGAVPRVRWDDPQLEGFLRRNAPVVITGGCPLTRQLVGRWSFPYLSESFPADNGLSVHFAPRGTRRFTRFYGKGLGKGGVTPMPFRKFAAVGAANEREAEPAWRYYLQTVLVWGPGRGRQSAPSGTLRTPKGVCEAGVCEHAQLGAPLVDDMRGRFDWAWLAQALSASKCEGLHSCTIWAGHGGGATPIHFDALSNFFTQLVGRKRVLVFPPAQSWRLYPYPASHPMDSYAMVDVEEPDLHRYPGLARARALETILEPGDVLWLPSFNWHYVRRHLPALSLPHPVL